ncbi:MAG: beta-ketoacyl-ACP synthase III [Candidatus Omnitrophota bacterium]
MSEKFAVGITGLGAYLPTRILTNHDLEKMVETSDEWITTRTGIKERRIAEPHQRTSDLGLEAAKHAIRDAGLTPADIELIVVATITPDMFFPSTACNIQAKLGASCGAFDMAAACSGFPYALGVAEGFVRAGLYKNILVVGAELLSKFINWKDRSTCVLFGDGAGAAIVSRVDLKKGHGLCASYLGADGNQAELLQIPGGGSANPSTEESVRQGLHFLKMQGSEIFKIAVKTMENAVRKVLEKAGWTMTDVDMIIPHQANHRILTAVADRLEVPMEKVFINVDKYGNMSSASTIVALCEAVKSGRVKKGDRIVLVAFGGGLTWAASAIRW